MREAAVASGKTDFIALGRTLVADPQWVEKVARGEPIRRCLACNTCINEMRGGARIGCVVNGAAGRETVFADAQPPRGERIAVIGAGPAGLTYASLVADGNTVTVFEKDTARRRLVPLCRQGAAVPGGRRRTSASFERYIADMVAACELKRRRVPLRDRRDGASPDSWRRSIASSSRPAPPIASASGRSSPGRSTAASARCPASQRLFSSDKLRDWFYYRARRGSGDAFTPLARPGQKVTVIGDAVQRRQEQAGHRKRVRGGAAGQAQAAMSAAKLQEPSCRQSFIPDVAVAHPRL